MKTYTIYLFRHGLTKGNLNAQYIGHTDLPLTTDSISALRSIKARHHYPEVQAVFVSPLKRCIESADIMFPKNNPLVINDLIEYDFGEFEGCTAEDLKDNEDFKRHGNNCHCRPCRCSYGHSFLLRHSRSSYGTLADGSRLRL